MNISISKNNKYAKASKKYNLLTFIAPIISFLPLSLFYLLKFANTDKQEVNGHQYGKTYQRLMKEFKYKKIRFLEIGIGGYENHLGGESLAAWRSYFPFGQIVGCDIVNKRELSRIGIAICEVDQSDIASLNRLEEKEGPFDIMLDDGSHINRHQILTFKELFPKLNDGGLYIIEDVQTSYWADLGGAPVEGHSFEVTCMGWFTRLARYINYPEFEIKLELNDEFLDLAKHIGQICFEHNLIIIKKCSTPKYSTDPRINKLQVIPVKQMGTDRAP